MSDARVNLSLTLVDAEELSDNLAFWSDEWEFTDGERIELYDRVVVALNAAFDAKVSRDLFDKTVRGRGFDLVSERRVT